MPTGPKGEKRPTDVNARAETLPSAQRRHQPAGMRK